MESLLLFLHIIAWFTGIISTVMAGLLTYMALSYPGSIEEISDKLKGYTREFRPIKFWVIALVCWAFIIAF